MDLSQTDILPDPLPNNQYWIDGTTPNERILRPDFTISFTSNSQWHSAFIEKFRASAESLATGCSAEMVKSLKNADIKKLINRHFKYLKGVYKTRSSTADTHRIHFNAQNARRRERKSKV